jgi:hypothetical protein
MTIDNVAALASPVYNPNISLQTLAIYNQFAPPSPEVYAQYLEIYMSLPTTNPFMGVVSNPVLCDINQAQLNLSQLNAANNGGADTGGSSGNNSTVIDPQLQNSLDTISSALSDYQDQTNRVVSNLPSILGLIQLAMGLATALACGKSPCKDLQGFLNTLLSGGRNLINSINAQIQNLMNLPLAMMANAIAGAVAMANTLSAMVANEVSKIVNSMISAARLGLADMLSNLGIDPCILDLLPQLGFSAPALQFMMAPINMPNFQFPNPCA